jgi:hypothetical protein
MQVMVMATALGLVAVMGMVMEAVMVMVTAVDVEKGWG